MNFKSLDEMSNMLIVDDKNEKPEEIVEDYFQMIVNHKDDHGAILIFLEEMFDDINYWTIKQMLIDQAKMSIDSLQVLEEIEHEFIEDDADMDDL